MDSKNRRYIGVCLGRIQENLNNDLIHSIIDRAVELGFKVLIYNAFTDFYLNNNYDAGESHAFDLIDFGILDGLIVLSETIHNDELLNSIINRAKEEKVCTVCVDKHVEGCINISFNYKKAFESIVEHTITVHGCRVINLVAGFKNNPFSDERIDCCRRIMKAHGMELDESRIMYGDFWADPTARAFDEFMESGMAMPDAFICCNDTMAITLCSKLKERGFSVPTDVIVTGFDGILEERYHIPRLTTAKQDVKLAGIKAVDSVEAFLNGEAVEKECVVDHCVCISHSCGCRHIDYREATGHITPLFKKAEEDNSYDTYMDEFSNTGSDSSDLSELGEVLMRYSTYYGHYYYCLSLEKDFSKISANYESFISDDTQQISDSRRLILCELLFENRYKPVFADTIPHFEEAADRISVFLFWSVHFRGMVIGHGITGLSTGSDGLSPNDDFRHLLKYTRTLNHVLEIYNSKSVMTKVIRKLNDLYIHDHTGLYNRRGFYTEIEKQIAAAVSDAENTYYLIIISVDLDELKSINDIYGHSEGDAAIKSAADALMSVGGEDKICSRFGGDEFVLSCVCRDDPETAGNDMAKRIKDHLDDYNSSAGKPYNVRASIGIHYGRIGADTDIDSIIKAADDKMYRDKSAHRHSCTRSVPRK